MRVVINYYVRCDQNQRGGQTRRLAIQPEHPSPWHNSGEGQENRWQYWHGAVLWSAVVLFRSQTLLSKPKGKQQHHHLLTRHYRRFSSMACVICTHRVPRGQASSFLTSPNNRWRRACYNNTTGWLRIWFRSPCRWRENCAVKTRISHVTHVGVK